MAIFERAVHAIWRAHGDAMADFQQHALLDDSPAVLDPVRIREVDPDDELF